MKRHLQRKIIAGLLTIIPIVVTVWDLYFLFKNIEGILSPLLQPRLGKYYITGMGLIALLALIYLIGLITSNFIGNRIVRLGERIVERVPLARNVYSTAKQLMQTIVLPQGEAFKKVVLIEQPITGLQVIGFVTGKIISETEGTPLYKVFLPTSPNPTTEIGRAHV